MSAPNLLSISRLAFDGLLVLLALTFLLYPAAARLHTDEEIDLLNRCFYGVVNNDKDWVWDSDWHLIDILTPNKTELHFAGWCTAGSIYRKFKGQTANLVKMIERRPEYFRREFLGISQLVAFHLLGKAFDSEDYTWLEVAKLYLDVGFKGELIPWLDRVFKFSGRMAKGEKEQGEWRALREEFVRIDHKEKLIANGLVRKALEFWPNLKAERQPPPERRGQAISRHFPPLSPPPSPGASRRGRRSPLPAVDLLSGPMPDNLISPLVPRPPPTGLVPPGMDPQTTARGGQRSSGASFDPVATAG